MIRTSFFDSEDRQRDSALLELIAPDSAIPRKGDRISINGKYGWVSGEVIHVGWLFDKEENVPVTVNVVILKDRRS